MSDINTNATVNLVVNGQQALQVLQQLKQRAMELENAIAKAAASGNKVELRKLRRELADTKRQIREIETSTMQVESVMRRLDKATPKELNRALQTLNRQLDYMERGSAAWNAHVTKIQAVKAELSKVNAELRNQQSFWDRFNNKLNQWQTSLMGIAALLTGLVMAGRKAVNSFAEMEEEMANTLKYTGMAREEVEAMNDAFKSMDTRTGRDKLNELAQEAGRLGKNTRESVQGYVEAADIINVALVDLGEGATQVIAKLTNIFGVEQLMGTKDAMLAVGSTVNVLSQNCTASKPYLVQFAQRLAGVGAQARMTIPEILAFAATLDANGQKVEMSASALSRLIMMLFQKPRELAATVGLDVQKFTETLTKSTNEGVLMFLGKLQEIGEADALAALSPLFKDLGMDGIRMSQVLATLATHLDMVKWEQEEANKAFTEATSATREYNIFNNTAQAGIDKARKRVHELAVELGEKLLPVYRHIMTSGSAMLRFLNVIVDFVIRHKTALVTLTAAIVGYTVAVNASNIATRLHYTWLVLVDVWNKAVKGSTLLLSMAYNTLTGNITRANAAQKLFVDTFKTTPWGLAIAAVTALAVGIYNLASKTDEYTESVKKNIKAANDVSSEYVNEQRELDLLFGKLKGAEKGSDDYKSAKKAIIDQYGKYLSGLIDEKGEIINLTDAYDRLTEAIRRSARERGIAAVKEKMEQEYTQQTADDLNRLQESLEKYGVSAQLAAKTVQQVASALIANKPIPQDALKVIEGASRNMPWYERWTGGRKDQVQYTGPAGIVNNMYRHQGEYTKGMAGIEAMENANAPLRNIDTAWLKRAIEGLESIVKSSKNGSAIVFVDGSSQGEYKELTPKQASDLLAQYRSELAYRGNGGNTPANSTPQGGSYTPTGKGDKPTTTGGSTKAEDKFKAEKEWKEREEALNRIAYATGQKNYEAYTNRMLEILTEYEAKRLAHTDLTATERLTIEAQYREAQRKQTEQWNKFTIEEENEAYREIKALMQQRYIDGRITTEQYNANMELIEMQHLQTLAKIYERQAYEPIRAWEEAKRQAEESGEGGESGETFDIPKPQVDEKAWQEYLKANDTYLAALVKDQQKRQKEYEDQQRKHQQQLQKIKDEYFGNNAAENLALYNESMANLEAVYQAELQAAGENAREKLRIEEVYEKAKLALKKKYNQLGNEDDANALQQFNADLLEWLEGDGGQAFTKSVETLTNGMSSIFSQISSLVQSEMEIETAAIEKRYQREISMAEGNKFKTKIIERQKEKEVAKVKNEANRKLFAMQVIQAVAQTATAALNAYSSAAAVPVVGYILAPIAAAMAVAAGTLQVAAIKKQQQASLAQGYAEGGFTRKGRADEVAGVVHAGEWVASQKLLASPVARPLIEALDYAQRTNTIGSLKSVDVSRSITAPMALAQSQPQVIVQENKELKEIIARLSERLDEPFVTVNTVTGDMGIKQAQDEYQRLMNNKSPKNKRK